MTEHEQVNYLSRCFQSGADPDEAFALLAETTDSPEEIEARLLAASLARLVTDLSRRVTALEAALAAEAAARQRDRAELMGIVKSNLVGAQEERLQLLGQVANMQELALQVGALLQTLVQMVEPAANAQSGGLTDGG